LLVNAILTHDRPETQKLPPRSSSNILDKRPRVLPVSEADAWSAGYATEINYQTQDDQENDKEDLEECEPELDFTVDTDCREAYRDCKDDCDNNPYRLIDIRPVLEENADGAYLGRDREQVSVDEVIAVLDVSSLHQTQAL
jgi:hypothetical protein